MKHVLPLVLVLWGHHCDEITAVTAVVQNRRAGRRTQLVGLDNRNRRGANGVQLVTDLTLSEAVAQASAVHSIILSMDLAGLLRYLDDPRVVTLLQNAIDSGATLVTHDSASTETLNETSNKTRNETINQISRVIQRDIRTLLQIAPDPQK